MISSINAGSYSRPAQALPSTMTLTRANALSETDADASAAAGKAQPGFRVSDLKRLDTSGLKVVSVRDNPELRDLMTTNWLRMKAADAAFATEVPDNAPQNIYATVKVKGNVVATLYNAGSSAMTNEAAAKVGDLQDPPGLGGPDLAQWRAERIAKAVGGTVEKASTAITQSQWRPRESVLSTTYSREQLDAAFEAMMAERQTANAQRQSGYSPPQSSTGVLANVNA